jgi:hypothetical protein
MTTTNAFPHAAYLNLAAYFIAWYKLPPGSPAPPIPAEQERLLYFYNLQPIRNPCPQDPVGPPSLNSNARYPVEDAVYATLLLAAPANITMVSGEAGSGQVANMTFLVEAGVQSVRLPGMMPGTQRFIVFRGSALLANISGAERVNSTEQAVAVCNAQTFTGSVSLRPTLDVE